LPVAGQHAAYFPDHAALCEQLSRELLPLRSYDLVACTTCGVTFASPMSSPGGRWYDLAYSGLHADGEERWEYGVVLRSATKDDTVYEFGCGTGKFLRRCAGRGVAAHGVDFSQRAVDACRAAGLDASVVATPMSLQPASSRPASVVAAFHVIEHLESPDELLRHARANSRPGASLWLSVPSERRTSRLYGHREPLDEPPHHLTRWTSQGFAALGTRNGWRLDAVEFEPFSWRAGLWSVVSRWSIYDAFARRGWLRHRAVERSLRAALYPAAAVYLTLDRRRQQMSGFSMLARYTRLEDER
jgi:SAM-dependent methyltransferase